MCIYFFFVDEVWYFFHVCCYFFPSKDDLFACGGVFFFVEGFLGGGVMNTGVGPVQSDRLVSESVVVS